MCFTVLFLGRRGTSAFQPQPPLEPEPSGSHLSHPREIPVLPLFTLLETFAICYHRSCLFRSLRVSTGERCPGFQIPLIVHLSSFLIAAPYFTLFWIKYPGLSSRTRVDVFHVPQITYPPYIGTGLFLFGRAEIKLPLLKISTRWLLGRFFSYLNLTSGSPKTFKLKIYP